jgi:hypothetical protein
MVGLGLGVALVVAIASVSSGLNAAQKKTLNPLAGIGTDLTVTLAPQQDQTAGFGPGGGGRGGSRDLLAANQSVLTDSRSWQVRPALRARPSCRVRSQRSSRRRRRRSRRSTASLRLRWG